MPAAARPRSRPRRSRGPRTAGSRSRRATRCTPESRWTRTISSPTSRASRGAWQHERVNAHSILVVDDNAEAAEVMAVGLELLGQDVRTVLDGESALALLADWRPDIAILDLTMPGMSGTE